MNCIKEKLKSVRVRLFISLCVVVAIIVLFLIIINNVVLESFYLYSKIKNVRTAYEKINEIYNTAEQDGLEIGIIEEEIDKIAIKNDFEIIIMNNNDDVLYSSDKNFTASVDRIKQMIANNIAGQNLPSSDNGNIDLFRNNNHIIYESPKVTIRRILDEKNSMNYIFLSASLDNGNLLYIRIQVSSIQESVQISNRLLILIGGASIIIASALASFISRKYLHEWNNNEK